MNEEMDKLKKKVFKHPNAETLEIKRVPKDTVKAFKEFANENFVGDYGFALKWLVDQVIIEDVRFTEVFNIIDDLSRKVDLILAKDMDPEPEKPKVEYKTMVSGKKIPIPIRD